MEGSCGSVKSKGASLGRCQVRSACRTKTDFAPDRGSEPEYRLPSTIVGAWVVPISLFGRLLQVCEVEHNANHVSGFGWTTYATVSFVEGYGIVDD